MKINLRVHKDTALLDWLDTFGGTVEYDDVTRLWTVRPREPGYPACSARSLRGAAQLCMCAAEAADARAPLRLHRMTSGL